jgi:hypothetical protein
MALVAGAVACATVVSTIGIKRKELRDPYLGSAVDPRVTEVERTPERSAR